MLKRRSVLALAAASPLLPGLALAQAKTLKVVVGYPPGGPTDALARIVAQVMGEALGQPAIVENQAGAMGAIGARTVARAAPDGQTLLLCTSQSHGTNPTLFKAAGYDALNDFTMIAGLADIQQVLVVRKDLPVNTVQELIKYAKARPGKLNYASTGSGAGAHLAMEMFKQKTGVDIVHIPFKGGAQMTTEIIAGRIDATFATLSSVLGQIKGGTMRAIALASNRPSPQLPDVPLLKDQGVVGCEADSWLGLLGPAGMPPAMVDRYYRAMADAFAKPAIHNAIVNAGMVVNIREPAVFRRHMAAEIDRWAAVIRAADIKLDAA